MKKIILITPIILMSSIQLMAQEKKSPDQLQHNGLSAEIYSGVNFAGGPVMPGIGANLHFQKGKNLFTAGVTAFADFTLFSTESKEFTSFYLLYGIAKGDAKWKFNFSAGPGLLTKIVHTTKGNFFFGQPATSSSATTKNVGLVLDISGYYQPRKFGIGFKFLGNINPAQSTLGIGFGIRYRF
jgi:hypothetical protein